MTTIRINDDTAQLDGFPPQFTVVGHDDLGDVLASDGKGKIWLFPHGNGDWTARSVAFASRAQLDAFVAFQHRFEVDEAADLPKLLAQQQDLRAFSKSQPRAPYSRNEVARTLEHLRDVIADRRWQNSVKGKQLATQQELGLRCEQALRDAGAPGAWTVRALATNRHGLGVMGEFAAPWTETAVRALLQPLVGERVELVCITQPRR